MIFLPQIKKEDELYGIIYLPQWLYKNKYSRLICCCCVFAGVGYLCLFVHYAITEWKSMIPLDILLTVTCLEVTVICVSLLDEEKTILEINQLQVQYFWDNNFLNEPSKRKFDQKVKISVYLHYALWVITILLVIAISTAPYFPQTIYYENWSYLTKFVVRTCGYLFLTFGHYVAATHESFYAYTILHGYFQMNTLKYYLRQEVCRYEKIDSNKKIYSYRYQTLIEDAFLRCIKQHKKIVVYGRKIISIYNRWMVFHFLAGATIFSLVFYCYVYDPLGCEVALTFSLFQMVSGGMYYHIIGNLFSDGYENFHDELLNVKWYTLNRTNRQLYCMFLMFTQKKYEIELWPSLPINRYLVCRFMKWIYSGFTLLTSIKSNK